MHRDWTPCRAVVYREGDIVECGEDGRRQIVKIISISKEAALVRGLEGGERFTANLKNIRYPRKAATQPTAG